MVETGSGYSWSPRLTVLSLQLDCQTHEEIDTLLRHSTIHDYFQGTDLSMKLYSTQPDDTITSHLSQTYDRYHAKHRLFVRHLQVLNEVTTHGAGCSAT